MHSTPRSVGASARAGRNACSTLLVETPCGASSGRWPTAPEDDRPMRRYEMDYERATGTVVASLMANPSARAWVIRCEVWRANLQHLHRAPASRRLHRHVYSVQGRRALGQGRCVPLLKMTGRKRRYEMDTLHREGLRPHALQLRNASSYPNVDWFVLRPTNPVQKQARQRREGEYCGTSCQDARAQCSHGRQSMKSAWHGTAMRTRIRSTIASNWRLTRHRHPA